ncbi:hypothetical protein [Listeria grayi]|uniref:hypothetical protein n=1 Tax=Listeria grayi TaxID=1641 RepID=UPI0016273A3A|nr:hypothetical protein [Listeria grayi]MBC1921712.1 hypothetical protein [Listeria grayi]
MKKSLFFLIFIISIVLLAGCSQKNDTPATSDSSSSKQEKQDKQTTSKKDKEKSQPAHASSDKEKAEPKVKEDTQAPAQDDKPLTESQVIEAVKGQVDAAISLPQVVPLLKEGNHLTAKTSGDFNNYTVTFFESAQPIPINNKKLNDPKAALKNSVVTKKTYASIDKAQAAINFENYSNTGSNPVNLGSGIQGYSDAGAGQKYLSWNEGRWAISVHSSTIDAEANLALARKTVALLNKLTLPIPHQFGSIIFNLNEDDHNIMWQEGTVVYSISGKEPIKILQEALHFDK